MSGTVAEPFLLPNDWILSIPNGAATAAGTAVALPSGDVESVAVVATPASATPGLAAVLSADGTATLVNALVDGSASAATVYAVTWSDTAGLSPVTLSFQIVPDTTPTTLMENLAGATHTNQAIPPAG